jgi:hypothetical protein
VQRTVTLNHRVNYNRGDKNKNRHSGIEALSAADAIFGEILTAFVPRQGRATANAIADWRPNCLTFVRSARGQEGTGRYWPLVNPLLLADAEDVQRTILRDVA